jgi:hypothetical protein
MYRGWIQGGRETNASSTENCRVGRLDGSLGDGCVREKVVVGGQVGICENEALKEAACPGASAC